MVSYIKTFFVAMFVLLTATSANGQIAPGEYVVFYNTKNGTPYTIDQPEAYLTARALERRATQNIQIDSTDLPVNPAFIDSLQSVGAQIRFSSRWFNFTVIKGNDSVLEEIEKFSFVQNTTKRVFAQKSDPDKLVNKFENEYDKSLLNGPGYEEVQGQINIAPLHNMGYRGAGMRVAIIDAGFTGMNTMNAFSHLYDEDRLVATANFAQDTTVYYGHTHGTAVGSIMCADLENEYLGAATEAEYVLIRSETGSSEYVAEEYSWVAAAEFSDSIGVDVINSSLGYTTFDWPSQDHTHDDLDGESTIVSRAAGKAFEKGILVVVSAGNLGNAPWQYVSVPADHPDVLTIGSVNINGDLSGFSSVGLPEHDFKPDVVACGELAPYVFSDFVYNGSGTSFSSPLIAAAATCLWQAYPDSNNEAIANAIRSSGDNYPNGNNLIGYGIPDFEKAYASLDSSSLLPDDPNVAECISVYSDQNGAIHLHVYTPENTSVQLKVFDLQGKLMIIEESSLVGGSINELVIDGPGKSAKGQYLIVNLEGQMFDESRKVFID